MYAHHPPYYFNQHGAGLPVFRGSAIQKGYGLGGLFRGLLQTAAPVLKQGLISVGKSAMKAGVETLSDVARGENVKSALKIHAKQNLKEMMGDALRNKRRKTTTNSVSRCQSLSAIER